MLATENGFPLFLQLPVELREEIWGYCLPYRVCELDAPAEYIAFDLSDFEASAPCHLWHTTRVNRCPPLITRVCREARAVAFRTGSIADTRDEGRPFGQAPSTMWRDRVRDIAHLNWTPRVDVVSGFDAGMEAEESALDWLAWHAQRLSGHGSLMMNFMGVQFPSPNPFDRLPRNGPPIIQPLSARKQRDLEAVGKLAKWLVVMRVIVVHSDIDKAAATGLFGLSGDARVQVVDIAEETRVDALFDMAKKCEPDNATVSQSFERQGPWSVESMERRLRDRVEKEYHTKEQTMTLRPAIMFRLCTQECNSRVDEQKCDVLRA